MHVLQLLALQDAKMVDYVYPVICADAPHISWVNSASCPYVDHPVLMAVTVSDLICVCALLNGKEITVKGPSVICHV